MSFLPRELGLFARGGLLAGLLAMISTTFVAAQDVSAENRARLETMFDEILKNPTNLDLTYDYARLATAAGDYEAAITAYERLLLFNPSLPRVKAELGVLYYRLGSFDTAKAYLEQALSEGDAPPAARQRIESFLAQIANSKTRHLMSGSLAFGTRYQTNGNAGPDGQILVNDVLFTADDGTAGEDDFNMFAALSGRYVYDLGVDSGDFFAVEGTLYGARQFKFTELDVEHARIVAGPGFRIYPKASGPVLFRPSVRLTYARLDDESYNFAYGASMDFSWQAFDETSLFVNAFAEAREYYATTERTTADTQDGAAVRFTAGALHNLNDRVTLRGEVLAGRVYAFDPSEAYQEIGGAISVSARLTSPFEGSTDMPALASPWSLSTSLNYAHRDYEGANTLVSATVRQEDEIRIEGTLAAPIAKQWSLFATLGYQNNAANLPNNDYDNFSATLGANMRF